MIIIRGDLKKKIKEKDIRIKESSQKYTTASWRTVKIDKKEKKNC